jgi:membrane-bound lytic murein transglycosylase D
LLSSNTPSSLLIHKINTPQTTFAPAPASPVNLSPMPFYLLLMTDELAAPYGPVQARMAGESDAQDFARSFNVGRAPGNDVVIDDEQVSQQHASVTLIDGKWYIEDLGSSNGLFVAGKQIEKAPVSGTLLVRFGHDGPTLVLSTAASDAASRKTMMAERSESQILSRFLGGRTPADMSRHTALLRKVLRTEQIRRAKRYWITLAMLAVVTVIASTYVYVQRKQLERARIAAADLFYTMKSLELEIAQLQLSATEAQSFRNQREKFRLQYLNYLEQLGIYSDDTPQPVRLIYRIVHRFGESEVNVPRPFVDEVLHYIERWRVSGRLEQAVARAKENNYGHTIADVMLRNDMPPEFFYLALQESDLKVEAVGRETRYGIAKGMWQFMPATARAYGLQTGPLVGVAQFDPRDDRHDVEESTRAAAEYIRDVYTSYAQASGLLVMASYNWGQGNVSRLIRTMPENPRERNFWKLMTQYRDRIPDETYHYVFSIVSAAVIGESPDLFGFDFDPPLPRQSVTTESIEGP